MDKVIERQRGNLVHVGTLGTCIERLWGMFAKFGMVSIEIL